MNFANKKFLFLLVAIAAVVVVWILRSPNGIEYSSPSWRDLNEAAAVEFAAGRFEQSLGTAFSGAVTARRKFGRGSLAETRFH